MFLVTGKLPHAPDMVAVTVAYPFTLFSLVAKPVLEFTVKPLEKLPDQLTVVFGGLFVNENVVDVHIGFAPEI